MNRSSSKTIFIVILVVLAVVVGYMVFTGKTAPSDTDGPVPVTEPPSVDPSMVRITDTANLYSVEVPNSWKVVQEGAMGVQRSQIIAESPDWRSYSDESAEGPFTPIYYENGAFIQFHVSNKILSPPYHGSIVQSENILIDGMTAAYHSFKEPSVQEGVLLDAHLTRENNYYVFRFAYNPTTYPEGEKIFMDMLDSIRFTK